MIDYPQISPHPHIVGVAAVFHGMVAHLPRPHTHQDLLDKLHELGMDSRYWELGFFTSECQYANRRQAGEIALKAEQVLALSYPPALHVCDLW